MTVQRQAVCATSAGAARGAVPRRARAPKAVVRPGRGARVTDLRGTEGTAHVRELDFPARCLVVVSGLPGGGKSTLMQRVVPALDRAGAPVHRIDSQDVRERWEAGRLGALPYGLLRPLVRIAHYRGLRRALRSGDSVVVHDCGTVAWVRRWIARTARRDDRELHLLLLDVPAEVALSGQRARGRGVSGYAFARHRRAVDRLLARARAARLPKGFTATVLLDRRAAEALERTTFG
ncbi:AAA family ATPase [Streptomyces olivaceiscleroticus]|uniref:AAA family ATPase n=1 Tax=Streptomyces olivaceiscleroticus TaxID=68245 RepID=UPI0031F84C52